MSRIGRRPIPVPTEVQVQIADHVVRVKGPKGELSRTLHPDMIIEQQDGQVLVQRPDESREHKALHGLTRTLIANMVEGVTQGYTKTLEITGVGYRAAKQGDKLTFQLGY